MRHITRTKASAASAESINKTNIENEHEERHWNERISNVKARACVMVNLPTDRDTIEYNLSH